MDILYREVFDLAAGDYRKVRAAAAHVLNEHHIPPTTGRTRLWGKLVRAAYKRIRDQRRVHD